MRSTIILSAFAALAAAAPRPQDIALDAVDAAPDPTIYTVTDGTSPTVSIMPLAAMTTIADATVTNAAGDNVNSKRALGRRDGDCSPLPRGFGPVPK